METQDPEESWHILHSHKNWLSSSPSSAVSYMAYQTHKGTGKHTPTALAMLSATGRISHLIMLSPSATGRRLSHPKFTFRPCCCTNGSILSLYVFMYTHTYIYTGMTAFFSNAKKPQETDCAPYRMAQEYKAHVDSSDTQAASQ